MPSVLDIINPPQTFKSPSAKPRQLSPAEQVLQDAQNTPIMTEARAKLLAFEADVEAQRQALQAETAEIEQKIKQAMQTSAMREAKIEKERQQQAATEALIANEPAWVARLEQFVTKAQNWQAQSIAHLQAIGMIGEQQHNLRQEYVNLIASIANDWAKHAAAFPHEAALSTHVYEFMIELCGTGQIWLLPAGMENVQLNQLLGIYNHTVDYGTAQRAIGQGMAHGKKVQEQRLAQEVQCL